jgi:hypothetical protein
MMVQIIGSGVDRGGADATIHSSGSGSGRYEETVRAYRGLLTVKILQESRRSVQMVERARGYHNICG